MDQFIRANHKPDWQSQLAAFRERAMDQLTTAFRGKDAVAHLGWYARDENCRRGLDPLNMMVVDCVYQAATSENVPRIYMASSVHAYDFFPTYREDVKPIQPFPDVREEPFGTPPTTLYGVSKRWMEIAGQFYARQLNEGQKILVVRLGGVNDSGKPHRPGSPLWNSHRDLAGLLQAFIETEGTTNYWVAFGISDNRGGDCPRPLFDPVNPYGFTPADNSSNLS